MTSLSELELVQRVYDRIAAAATDEQLEAELLRYLAPVINKLSSTQDAVRNTIVEMLGHVNRRVKDHHHIQLPVEALLDQFSSDVSAFVVNFSLVYIKMGFPRLDDNKQVELLPKLLSSLENKSSHLQDSLLRLLLPVLGLVKCSDALTSPLMSLREKPHIAKILLDYMQDILLLPYGATPRTREELLQRLQHQQQRQETLREEREQRQLNQPGGADEQDDEEEEEESNENLVPVPAVPAGMSIVSFRRAIGDHPLKPDDLETLKKTVIKFLDTEILTPSSMAHALMIATSDTRFTVADAADSLLRRMDGTIEWNSSPVISAMYVLFLGTLTPIERGPVERFKNPANTRIRLKLMPCFLKSREAANYSPLAVKVFCECLWGSHTNNRLKQQGITFLHHVSFSASTEKLKPVGSLLFSGVVKIIEEEKNNAKLTSLAYGALAKLSLKLPNLLLSHQHQLHYLMTLMDALSHEVGDVLLAIQEALSMVAPVCKQLTPASQDTLCIMLSEHVQSDNPALRRTAVHYAATVFSRTHCASRFIMLLATGDSEDDVRLEATRELYKSSGGDDSNSTPKFESPGFLPMLRFIVQRINDIPRSRWRDVATTSMPYTLKVMEELLLYLQHCLAVESGSNSTEAGGNSLSAVSSFKEGALMWPNCTAVGRFVEQTLGREEDGQDDPFAEYLRISEMAANAWSASAVEAIVRLVAVAPTTLARYYTDRMDWIRRFLVRGGHAGQVAALLYGIVAGQISDLSKFEHSIQLIRHHKEQRMESQECFILAMGHSLAFAQHRIKHDNDVIMEDRWLFFDNVVCGLVVQLVNSEGGTLLPSLVVAVGEVARHVPLPIPVFHDPPHPTWVPSSLLPDSSSHSAASQEQCEAQSASASETNTAAVAAAESSSVEMLSKIEEKPTVAAAERSEAKNIVKPTTAATTTAVAATKKEPKPGSLVNVVEILQHVYENNKLSSKIREQAIQSAGYLCVGDQHMHFKPAVMESLLELSKQSDEMEIHFSVGGALSDCVLGAQSVSSRNLWTQNDPNKEESDNKTSVAVADGTGAADVSSTSPAAAGTNGAAATDASPTGAGAADAGISDVEPMDTTDATTTAATTARASTAVATTEAAGPPLAESEVASLAWLLHQLLNKYIPMTKPSVRQASCIWLLTILKRCRYMPGVQDNIMAIQGAFMNLLGDNNELVQDAASKGLCVVYECCSEALRKSLVEGLVHALTEGKSRVSNVTGDTKLFREGELGTASTGGQLSTYKELCSLASDLNQPDLIYKFMNLANHNAIWNSRKGAAFGFGSLASQAGAQLEPYLPQIVPKLFRYQHDPTPRIQQPMAHIWSCLVTDTNKTTEKYYSSILSDLLSSLTSSLWRVRESSCSALTELIRQHSVVPAVPHLATLWTTLFKVRDDVKESVRDAASKTLQSLSKSCIKVCEAGGAESQQVMECVLPILLTAGISSSVADVRSVSLDAIVKLCRSGGAMIRPHLGTLVPALLEAIAGLEHQSLSYTSVRTASDDDRDRFDSLRVAAARGTPMMDTLNYVLQFVDDQVMESVIVGVVDVLKRSVGLTSRTTAAHVVETLTHTCPGPLAKFAGKILTALVNGLNDRNATIRKIFANAIGTVVKVAKSSSVEKLLNKLQTWYLEKEEDSVRMSVGITLRSMHRQSSDIMKDYASLALPLAFLAMHAHKTPEEDPTGTDVWEEIWSDNTPGAEAGIRLHLSEIIAVCEKVAVCSNWAMKSQSGRALSTMSEKVGHALTEEQTSLVVNLLLNTLQGRTWAGKESLILSLSTVVVKTKSVLIKISSKDDELLLDTVVKVMIREATKEKMEYKVHAIQALTTVLEEYQVDKFEVVFDICFPRINQSNGGSNDSSGSSSSTGASTSCSSSSNSSTTASTSSSAVVATGGSSSGTVVTEEDRKADMLENDATWKLLDELICSLGKAWPISSRKDTQERYSVRFVELLNASVSKVPRKTQLTVISTLGKYWDRHYLLLDTETGANASNTVISSSNSAGATASNTGVTATGVTTSSAGDSVSSMDVCPENASSEASSNSELTSTTASAVQSMPLYDPLMETQFDPVIQQSCKIFNYCLGISKYYSLRKQTLSVLLEMVSRIKGNPIILGKVSGAVVAAVEEARRDAQPDIQHLATTIHKILRA
uniref:Proteasome-associated protein ECM29 homolog n=2 Tax=Hirondellea gigas TaxID=1518452 RepID=A0A6A7FWF3_9CRUS